MMTFMVVVVGSPLKTVGVFCRIEILGANFFWQISMQLLSINSEPHFLLGGWRAERNILSFGKDLLLIRTKSEKVVVLQMKTFLGRPA